MTCKEKLKLEHPDHFDGDGDPIDCPDKYGYLPNIDFHTYCSCHECDECWNREVKEEKKGDGRMTILEKILTWVPDVSVMRLVDHVCPYDLLCNTNEYCDKDSSCDCRDCWMQPFNEKTHCKVGNFDSIVDEYMRDDLDEEFERIMADAAAKYDEQLKKAGEVAEEAPVPGTEEPKKPMTCKEKFEERFPDFKNDINEYCPSDFDFAGVPDYCAESESAATDAECERCWNREIEEPPKPIDISVEPGTVAYGRIKDSGARREFETGAVRDIQEGKGRCDLLPLDTIAIYVNDTAHDPYPERTLRTHLILVNIYYFQETGDVKYLHIVLNNILEIYDNKTTMFLEVSKHFEEGAKKYGEYNWQKGIPTHCYIDSAVRHYLKYLRGDKDEPHDRAFVWNILCCIWTCIHKPELNDYAAKATCEDTPQQKKG